MPRFGPKSPEASQSLDSAEWPEPHEIQIASEKAHGGTGVGLGCWGTGPLNSACSQELCAC